MIMKNVPIVPLALIAAITALASCSKNKYTNTDQLGALGKATISGKAYAKTVDTIGATPVQFAPSGTVIKAWVHGSDLVVGDTTGLRYGKKYYETTVGASGRFSLTVDVSKYDSVWVTIDPQAFGYDVIVKSGGTVKKENRWFKAMEFPFKKMGIGTTDTTAFVNFTN